MLTYFFLQKTHAYHKMKDDVPEDVKLRRLKEIIEVTRIGNAEINGRQVGSEQLVLIEGVSKSWLIHECVCFS